MLGLVCRLECFSEALACGDPRAEKGAEDRSSFHEECRRWVASSAQWVVASSERQTAAPPLPPHLRTHLRVVGFSCYSLFALVAFLFFLFLLAFLFFLFSLMTAAEQGASRLRREHFDAQIREDLFGERDSRFTCGILGDNGTWFLLVGLALPSFGEDWRCSFAAP